MLRASSRALFVSVLVAGLAAGAGRATAQIGSTEADFHAPMCAGDPTEINGVLGVDGTGLDNRPSDTGIASVTLAPGSMNLSLVVDPDFTPGDPSVSFRVEASDLSLDARGTVLVTDGAGLSCELCLNFRNLPEGPTFQELLCCADGIVFLVNNEAETPPGPSFCASNPLGPDDPPLPPGFEPSLPGDAAPCTVLTIDSPIAGLTEMVLKKDGDFDPTLRMLFSRSEDEGVTFGPWIDATESVVPITDILPDPTRVSGKKDWSPVMVTCARLAELCNGLDDDGDGLVDEGLPLGPSEVDDDADGFFLCPAEGLAADCNDENAAVNPAAAETCNGLDDDCDGEIDEGDPGGGEACSVPGQLGPCAAGITECIESVLECTQTVFPADEACDGVDNDCDGSVDDGNPGGGETCGVTDVGACELGATACVAGAFACVGNVDPVAEECSDGLDNDCDGQTDEELLPVAACTASQDLLNVGSEATFFKFNVSSLQNRCGASAVPLDASRITPAWVSRVGEVVLPDPFTLPCPDGGSFLFERGIVESDRKVTGNDVDLRFSLEADGDCRTLDGTRQELFALVAGELNDAVVPVCFRSTIDGVGFECCMPATVRNTGNR